MKTRNLLIRLDSDQLRAARLWLTDAISDPKGKDRAAAVLLTQLMNVTDAGDLTGTHLEGLDIEEQSAPLTAGDPPVDTKPKPAPDLPEPPKKVAAS